MPRHNSKTAPIFSKVNCLYFSNLCWFHVVISTISVDGQNSNATADQPLQKNPLTRIRDGDQVCPSEKTSLSPKSGHPYNQTITRPINFIIIAGMPGDTILIQGASPILTYNPPPQWQFWAGRSRRVFCINRNNEFFQAFLNDFVLLSASHDWSRGCWYSSISGGRQLKLFQQKQVVIDWHVFCVIKYTFEL